MFVCKSKAELPKKINELTPREQRFLLLYRQLDQVKQAEIKSRLTVFEGHEGRVLLRYKAHGD